MWLFKDGHRDKSWLAGEYGENLARFIAFLTPFLVSAPLHPLAKKPSAALSSELE